MIVQPQIILNDYSLSAEYLREKKCRKQNSHILRLYWISCKRNLREYCWILYLEQDQILGKEMEILKMPKTSTSNSTTPMQISSTLTDP